METAINTEQTVDLALLSDLSDAVNLEPRRETNADEATGHEEPTMVYDNGATSGGNRNFSKAQPQHFAFLLAYGLGSCATAAAGSGYEHTITPIDGDVDNDRSLPSFSLLTRFGKTVLKRRFISMFVDQVSATFAKDDWVKCNGTLKGTGKHVDNVVEESVTAPADSVSLDLAANGVEGADASGRLDNIQRIRVELTVGVWTEVEYTAVDALTPASITITAPSVDPGDVTYKILYVPTEGAEFDLPAAVKESPLRVAQMTAVLGGKWTGAAFTGGRAVSSEVNQIQYDLSNSLEINFVPGAGGAYAASSFRPARNQTLKVDRRFKDFILQQHMGDNDTFGFHILCQGAEFDVGHNYQVEFVFPRVAVLNAPISVNGKVLAEAGDFAVLEDDTHGSVVVKVKNLQTGYAQ
jgi:hypothetical protein